MNGEGQQRRPCDQCVEATNFRLKERESMAQCLLENPPQKVSFQSVGLLELEKVGDPCMWGAGLNTQRLAGRQVQLVNDMGFCYAITPGRRGRKSPLRRGVNLSQDGKSKKNDLWERDRDELSQIRGYRLLGKKWGITKSVADQIRGIISYDWGIGKQDAMSLRADREGIAGGRGGGNNIFLLTREEMG